MRKCFQTLFIVIAVLCILEYSFLCGIFTSLLMMGLVWIFGIVNLILSLREGQYHVATLYIISMIALNMGYWKLMLW